MTSPFPLGNKGSVNRPNSFLKVFVLNSNDDIHLAGSLVDHANIDLFLSQCCKEASSPVPPKPNLQAHERHAGTYRSNQSDIIGNFHMIRFQLTFEFIQYIFQLSAQLLV